LRGLTDNPLLIDVKSDMRLFGTKDVLDLYGQASKLDFAIAPPSNYISITQIHWMKGKDSSLEILKKSGFTDQFGDLIPIQFLGYNNPPGVSTDICFHLAADRVSFVTDQ
jgi:hypothetical protein